MCLIRTLALITGVAVLSSCNTRQNQGEAPEPASQPSAAAVLPVAEPPLDREALLMAVTRAASAAASGMADQQTQRNLDGKLFKLRLRFGCGPAASSDPARSWSFDEEKRVLRVKVEPEIDIQTALVAALGVKEVEAVEGFWVRRPWMLTSGCPISQPSPLASSPSRSEPSDVSPTKAPAPAVATVSASGDPESRIAIVQLFTEGDSRTHRRDRRAYENTKEDAADPAINAGFDLTIAGRLRRLPNGRVIACTITDIDTPPSCVISAKFEQVSIERGDNGEVLATWPSG
jgi:hypothetical protein